MQEYIKKQLYNHDLKLIIIAGSAGSLEAINIILKDLTQPFPLPIILCEHMSLDAEKLFIEHLKRQSNLTVQEAYPDDQIKPGKIYVVPGGYHLIIEKNASFSLCVGEKVSYCRPSIDVLLASAAEIYQRQLLAILLSGANTDGCKGCCMVKQFDGLVIVQDPSTAANATMPQAVITANCHDYSLSPDKIRQILNSLGSKDYDTK